MFTVAFGESTMSRTQVQLWHNRFKENREYANDDACPGFSTNEKIEAVKKMIFDNRWIAIRELARWWCWCIVRLVASSFYENTSSIMVQGRSRISQRLCSSGSPKHIDNRYKHWNSEESLLKRLLMMLAYRLAHANKFFRNVWQQRLFQNCEILSENNVTWTSPRRCWWHSMMLQICSKRS